MSLLFAKSARINKTHRFEQPNDHVLYPNIVDVEDPLDTVGEPGDVMSLGCVG